MFCLAAVLLNASAAQEEDVYKHLQVGDRIRVILRNGNTLTGTLVTPPGPLTREEGRPARPPAEPVRLLYFHSPDDPACQTQELALNRWLRRHPEVTLEPVDREKRAEAWKAHEVKEAPTLLFQDPASSRSLKLPPGFKGEADLTEALLLFRATAPRGPDVVDYLQEKSLTLDLSWEYPGLNGTLTISKDQIRAVHKLQALDPKTLAELEEEKKRLQAIIQQQDQERLALHEEYERQAAKASEEALRREREGREGEEEGARILKEAERLKQALEVYRRFPPPEWGPQKLEDIRGRAVRKQPLSPDDQEFLRNIDLWMEAKSYYDRKKGEAKTSESSALEKAPPPTEEKPPEAKGP